MIQGTTPTHIFNLPFDSDQVSSARVIYKQREQEILRKETEDFKMDGSAISVALTQEETFLFDCKYSVKLQLRVATKSGKVLSTKPIIIRVEECIDSEVL